MNEYVFVYGTLLRGCGNHRVLAGAEFVTTVFFGDVNYRMIHLGGFPGVVFDKDYRGPLYGEVYRINPSIEDRLDALEGYNGPDNPYNLYNKGVIPEPVYIGDVTIQPIMYVFNAEYDEYSNYPTIDTGNWKDRDERCF